MKEEPRRAQRICVPLIVEYWPVNSSQEWLQRTQGLNISLTGLCFRLAEQIPVGTRIMVRMGIVGDPQRVTATGRVVWMKEAGIVGGQPFEAGLQFTQVDPKGIRQLIQAGSLYWKEVTL